MATRKSASKTVSKSPAAKASIAAPKAEAKPAAATAKRAAPPAAKKAPTAAVQPAAVATARSRPVEAPVGEARYRWIAYAAYLRAEKRDFAPGQEIDDWLAAEAEFRATYGDS